MTRSQVKTKWVWTPLCFSPREVTELPRGITPGESDTMKESSPVSTRFVIAYCKKIEWFVGYTFNPNFNNSHFDRVDFRRSLVSDPRCSPRREFGDGEGGRNAGSYSRTAGGNRAQHFDTISIMMFRTKNKPESENSMTFKKV